MRTVGNASLSRDLLLFLSISSCGHIYASLRDDQAFRSAFPLRLPYQAPHASQAASACTVNANFVLLDTEFQSPFLVWYCRSSDLLNLHVLTDSEMEIDGVDNKSFDKAEEATTDTQYGFDSSIGDGDVLSPCSPYEPEDKLSVSEDGSEDPGERGNWGSQLDFLLSCMGYAIGLGNVWRFPYLCYENGGGAFLMVYCFLLVIAALPIMVLEMVFGQFSSTGCISAWTVSPLFKGIGFGMVLLSTYFCLYYNIIIAWTIYYMIVSCYNPLPWVGCDHEWNTEDCYSDSSDSSNSTTDLTPTLGPNSTTPKAGLNGKVWASEEYWKYKVLDMSDGLHDMGYIRWEIFGCFMAAWVIVYLCIIKGIKTSGKVVYFTATFPFLILIILLIRGATLPGAKTGILYFIEPKLELLAGAQLWTAAANQVIFSFGAGWGAVHTLASYNNYRNNCIRDCLILVVLGVLTSILAGLTVFSVLGFMAEDANVPIEDVVQAGPGLTFVAYPEALSRLPLPQLWSFLFFFMLLTLGLDSQFVTLETVITALVDEVKKIWPAITKYRFFIILGTCVFMSIAGLPLCFQGGIYLETLLDWYPAGYSPMIMGLAEIIVISYVYGYSNFRKDINSMLRYYPGIYWVICWLGLTPGLLILVLIATFIDYTPASLGDYIYPPWAQFIGWFLVFTSVACIIIYAIYNLVHLQEGSFTERVKVAVKPAREWGPANDKHRIEAGYEPLNIGIEEKEMDVYENEEEIDVYENEKEIDVYENVGVEDESKDPQTTL